MVECGSGFGNIFGMEGSFGKAGYGGGFGMDSESCGYLGKTPW